MPNPNPIHPFISHEWHVQDIRKFFKSSKCHANSYDLIILDPPYFTQSSKFYSTNILGRQGKLPLESWAMFWHEMAEFCKEALTEDGTLVLFEYPHNLQKLVIPFSACGLHLQFQWYIVPTPDSPGHWQRYGVSPHLKRPASFVETAVVFTRTGEPPRRPATDMNLSLRPVNYSNLYYDYRVKPGRNRPQACQGMKSPEFLQDMFRRLVCTPQGRMLDGFAGSGSVWRALSHVLKELKASAPSTKVIWNIDSIDNDPNKVENGVADHTFSSTHWWPKAVAVAKMCATLSREEVMLATKRSSTVVSTLVSNYRFVMGLNVRSRNLIIKRTAVSEHSKQLISFSHIRYIVTKLKKLDNKQVDKLVRELLAEQTPALNGWKDRVKVAIADSADSISKERRYEPTNKLALS